ncbi:MAG: MgtC/SapB family protein [Chloroflexi bacterium]|nr:MAG: MgtC/SapB family protein [Chloroflexota bacterium]
MDTLLLLTAKVAASTGIGLLIGLEREWAHKEAGVRSFAITALIGTLAWLVSPILAYTQLGIVLVIIIIVNLFTLQKERNLEITTSLALAVTNILGILVGMGAFLLPLPARL